MRTQNLLDNDREREWNFWHYRGWFDGWRWEAVVPKKLTFASLLAIGIKTADKRLHQIHLKLFGFELFITFSDWDCGGSLLSYGLYTDDDAVVFEWANKFMESGGYIRFFYVPWSWGSCVSREVLSCTNEFVPEIDEWNSKGKSDGRIKWVSGYNYVLRNGEVQVRTATYYVGRMTWYWRIFRKYKIGPKIVRTYIDIKFDKEVGERTGSWKGGCTGCSYDMLPGETPIETLRRMEKERKFT